MKREVIEFLSGWASTVGFLLLLAAGLYLVVRLAAALFKGEKILAPLSCVIVFWATFYMFLKAVVRS